MLKYIALSLIFVVSTLAAKIVGGDGGYIGNHPYQVSLQIRSGSSFLHHCGGSIIKADCILTAAHCVVYNRAGDFMIAAGSSNLSDPNAVREHVRGKIVHPSFNEVTLDNDVALVILIRALPINHKTIAPIDLATQAPQPGSWASATGWGDTKHGGYGSNSLLHVYVPIVDNDSCRKAYFPFYTVTQGMICAGEMGVGGKGICQGDSGGPLVYNGELVGVISWGVECARPDAPGVYANVAHLYNWIMYCSQRHS